MTKESNELPLGGRGGVMSVGLGRSYQSVGLNRMGAYLSVSKTKGPPATDRTGEGEKGRRGETERLNEIWRRYTGIYPGVKQSAKERKRGLRILARRIRERVLRDSTPHPRPLSPLARRGENGGAPAALAAATEVATTKGAATEVATTKNLSLANEWEFAAEDWARVQHEGISVEAVCFELRCSRARLTSLLKEYCGLSAQEFFDGIKFSSLKRGLVARLREAAWELWGAPGTFVAVKLEACPHTRPLSHKGIGENGGALRAKRSRYFLTRPEEMFEESRADERARRVLELCERLRVEFDLESWAIECGFGSGARLKRCCLNVAGKSLRAMEKMLAAEVVQFYLCAEDRQLREIALSDGGRCPPYVGRARELYHGDNAKPEAPFVDEWAKFAELKAEWLARMWDWFG